MKDTIIKRIKDSYKDILTLMEYGWTNDELNNYAAGVSNTLFDLIDDLQSGDFISDKEAEEIEEVFSNTIDTLEF